MYNKRLLIWFCSFASEDDKTLTGVIGNISQSNTVLIIILYIVYLVKLKKGFHISYISKFVYDTVSDVAEIGVQFAIKILTPHALKLLKDSPFEP